MSKNIYQRINHVQKQVKYVQKDAQITGGGSYKAVTHDQVVSVIRKHLVDAGIVIHPEQLRGGIIKEKTTGSGNVMYLYEGEYAIHFVNMDEPEQRVSATVSAHALDNGDKAPGKALTYATKAAMLKVFCLETGENDESRTEESYTPQQKELFDALVWGDDPVAFMEFFVPLPERAQGDLQNSAEKGQKQKLKQQVSGMMKNFHTAMDEYAASIRCAIAGEDEPGAVELVSELTGFEKQYVATRLDDNEIDWLKQATGKGE